MLRVNLFEDPTFRKDLLEMAKGVLRSVADEAIKATIREEGWLSKRVDKYFFENPVAMILRSVVNERLVHDPNVRELIESYVKMYADRQLAKIPNQYEEKIREMVAEEIRRRFIGPGNGGR
jgi:hypothetical protein